MNQYIRTQDDLNRFRTALATAKGEYKKSFTFAGKRITTKEAELIISHINNQCNGRMDKTTSQEYE